ncbi:hypothetical protein V6N12_030909 [Hibiscus sabdariffa]|uniref:Uncharacterized protein n=1 Tax=Hibiscus sabdariffa TaxID=183260 RepID=A0ABR2E7C8_9ROSI
MPPSSMYYSSTIVLLPIVLHPDSSQSFVETMHVASWRTPRNFYRSKAWSTPFELGQFDLESSRSGPLEPGLEGDGWVGLLKAQ